MTIDVRGPAGNVFCVLGVFQELTKQLEKAGCDVSKHNQLLKTATEKKYDEILDEVERLSGGTIKFKGREK